MVIQGTRRWAQDSLDSEAGLVFWFCTSLTCKMAEVGSRFFQCGVFCIISIDFSCIFSKLRLKVFAQQKSSAFYRLHLANWLFEMEIQAPGFGNEDPACSYRLVM